jgi:hypothetical protein
VVTPSVITAGAVAKAAMPLIASAAKASSSAAWKLYKSTFRVELPSQKDLSSVTDWLGQQIGNALAAQGEVLDSRLAAYLGSRDFAVMMQHIFVFIFAGRDPGTSDTLRSELELGLDRHDFDTSDEIDALFTILCKTAQKVADLAKVSDDELTSESNIEAHGIISAIYLESIDRQLRDMHALPKIDSADIDTLTNAFCAVARRKYGRIQPQSFDGVEPVPIDGLFVLPEVNRRNNVRGTRSGSRVARLLDSLDLHDIIGTGRAVLLGNPGGGKTTLTRKLAHDIAAGNLTVDGINGQIMPFIITIREFGQFLKIGGGSIADYIVETSNSHYQNPFDKMAVEYLLSTGRLYIIFDGLDELLDTQYRKDIAEVIDMFAWSNPAVNILVTSRTVGYAHNAMDSNVFTELALGGFTKSQVEEYVRKWFDLTSDLSLSQRDDISAKFMSESEHASDIRSNPLMLGLMCTIYKTESYIPRNRPDVYEKCSNMLFKTWDKNRGLFDPLAFEAHLDGVLSHVAYAVYNSPALQAGITQFQLSALAADYLEQWAYEQRVEAEAAAHDFFAFCKGRAWVLTEVGLNESGEGLFQFTHRTFLEYFAGMHLARKHPDPASLCVALLPGIVSGDLDVVAELAIQMNTKRLEGGSDAALRTLLEAVESSDSWEKSSSLLQFIARSLSYLVPSPPVVKDVVTAIVSNLLPYPRKAVDQGNVEDTPYIDSAVSDYRFSYLDAIVNFRTAARESKTQLVRAYASALYQLLQDEGTGTGGTFVPLEELVALAWASPQEIGFDPLETSERPKELDELKSLCAIQMHEHRTNWPWATVALYYLGETPIEDLIADCTDNALATVADIPRIRFSYVPPSVGAMRAFFHGFFLDEDGPTTARDLHSLTVIAEHLRGRQLEPINADSDSDDDGFNVVSYAISSVFRESSTMVWHSDRQVAQAEIDDVAVLIAALSRPSHYKELGRDLKDLATRVEGKTKGLCVWFRFVMEKETPPVAPPTEDPFVLRWAESVYGGRAVPGQSRAEVRTRGRHRRGSR